MAKKENDTLVFEQEENGETGINEDFYKMYQEELEGVMPCTLEEESILLGEAVKGDKQAKKRLIEGNLSAAAAIAEEYKEKGLPMGDLVQEANMALVLLTEAFTGGDFRHQLEENIRAAIEDALFMQDTEEKVEEEMAARVNVLKDISTSMAEELGREATVGELAERMKMTEDEIKDIMKLTLDAMSVIGE
ncbi:MAG: sigma-70 domain-containing protein [Clostridium sp.]